MSGSHKYVYYFGGSKAEGTKEMKALLGGKGANLAEMVNIGIPVPPGFTISTEVCSLYEKMMREKTASKMKSSEIALPSEVIDQIHANIRRIEAELGRKFGDPTNPLLFSVRSGAAMSMPGMMDTVLNLGLNDKTIESWKTRQPEKERFILDSYRRFITMYADVVMQVGREQFEHELQKAKERRGVKYDSELKAEDLRALCISYAELYKKLTKEEFPQDPQIQLFAAINAVFRSWNNPRAIKYRQLYHINGLLGTAVNIQSMVFGNFNNKSATGVAFSRSPSDGENYFYGEYLINAQGEDVVAGIRTPQQIGKELSLKWAKEHGISEEVRRTKFPSMEESMPENYKLLCDVRAKLELHYRDMQDIEFTVEDGKLWLLQCRNAKRTIRAAVRCAVEMVQEKLITEEEAVLRIDPAQVDHLLHPSFDPKIKIKPIAKGLAASPGAAVGQVVFNAEDAQKWFAEGKKVIMVRNETSPEDLGGMAVAQGILTVRGGMTSHAAVVARGMGKTCVCGAGGIKISGKKFTVGGKVFNEGDWISLDGTKGLLIPGKVPLVQPSLKGEFETILNWCKKFKRLAIRANADIPKDARAAFDFGAEGIGLCRTEHMFFEGNRIDKMREMILADTVEGRKAALDKILPLQREDFIGIFKAMKGAPCTIRLLDPPLHEFLPNDDKQQEELAAKLGKNKSVIAARVRSLHEVNPMLGLRGVRLGIIYPEIYDMQVKAIIEAAVYCTKNGIKVRPEIMIPLIGRKEEFVYAKNNVIKVAEGILSKENNKSLNISYLVGTMIEVPVAALSAAEIASEAEFFSFGTNDLTQMGCGFSRDDSATFLRKYVDLGIYERDPFESLDTTGVGKLIKIGVREGRSTNPSLKIGICGEHGGDPLSIAFCHENGLNYVSCSPYRVPVAIVAAAHASLLELKKLADERKKLYAKL